MILTEEQEVLDLIGMSQRVGTATTVRSNLLHATSMIENHVRTSFERTERIDFFGCPSNIEPPGAVPSYLLNLSQGFVDEGATFEVFYSNDGEPILSIADANAELQDPEAYDVNWKLGRVTLYGTTTVPVVPFRGVAVHYTAGFEVDTNDLAKAVPDAIRRGAATIAANNMRVHTPSQTTKQPYKEMQSNLRRGITGMLSSYIRPGILGNDPQAKTTV